MQRVFLPNPQYVSSTRPMDAPPATVDDDPLP